LKTQLTKQNLPVPCPLPIHSFLNDSVCNYNLKHPLYLALLLVSQGVKQRPALHVASHYNMFEEWLLALLPGRIHDLFQVKNRILCTSYLILPDQISISKLWAWPSLQPLLLLHAMFFHLFSSLAMDLLSRMTVFAMDS